MLQETKETATEANARYARNFRDKHKEKWYGYFQPYFKKWLEQPQNYFAHRCRNQVISSRKNLESWKVAHDSGKSADHIVPVRLLGLFFLERGVLKREDRKMISLLVSIANSDFNIRYIKKEKNTKSNHAKIDRQLVIAEKMEATNPVVCEGLVKWLEKYYGV
jgi:hypothetical protein